MSSARSSRGTDLRALSTIHRENPGGKGSRACGKNRRLGTEALARRRALAVQTVRHHAGKWEFPLTVYDAIQIRGWTETVRRQSFLQPPSPNALSLHSLPGKTALSFVPETEVDVGSDLPKPATDLLMNWSKGDLEAREALMPLVYDELLRLAAKLTRRILVDHARSLFGSSREKIVKF